MNSKPKPAQRNQPNSLGPSPSKSLCRGSRSSSAGELHPYALTEPYVKLSFHTALLAPDRPAARCEITTVLPGIRLTVALPLDEAAPSLQPHYRAFLTTTSNSAPVLRLGTQGLAGSACLTGSLHIGATGSHVPYGSQDHGHATSMPDAGWAIIGHPPTLSQERDPLLVSTSPENVSTRHQWFAHARLRDPHLTGIAGLFPNAHDNGF